MRVVIQRVIKASISVGEELVSEIGRGLCVLVGISQQDTTQDMEYMVKKVLNLRLFDGENERRWDKSVLDKQFEVLCVSQFTLYSILKGNKPDFHSAMGPDKSEVFYNEFVDRMKSAYNPIKIKDGKFGAHMQVNIQNDGPVTINVESPALTQQEREKYMKKQQRAIPRSEKKNGQQKQTNDGNADIQNSSSKNCSSACKGGITDAPLVNDIAKEETNSASCDQTEGSLSSMAENLQVTDKN